MRGQARCRVAAVACGEAARRAGSTQMAGMDLLLCSAQNVNQGVQARGELAADYRNGTLNGPAFLASVSRVVTLRQSPK